LVNALKRFFGDEEGLGTVEMVLLIAVLVGLALIFKDSIIDFVKKILDQITGQGDVFDPGRMGD
jgi:Flp pilus assembly pilin Flp